MRRLADPLLAGAIAGLLAGALEGVLAVAGGHGESGLGASVLVVLACAGLAAPTGALVGLLAVPLLLLWPPDRWRRMAAGIGAPALVGAGLALPFLAAVLFRLAHHFGTAYRNLSLASLAFSAAAVAAIALAVFLGLTTASLWRRLAGRWSVLERRSLAVGAIVLVWALLALPGLVAGADHALSGPFGFVGLVRKDTIDWRPVVVLVIDLGALVAGLGLGVRLSRTVRAVVFGLALLTVAGGAAAAGSASARPLILSDTVVARAGLRALQRAGDRDGDGHSRWLGGGDCDDANPRRHPGARETPDNGVDEDCDGEDLAAWVPPAEEPSERPARPELPENLSFVLVTVDSLRWDVGYAGYPRDVTPNIDALARRSVVYDRAYAISTYTGFAVPPLWASRYPSEMPRTDRHEVRFQPENVMLAERLAERGFRAMGTAAHFLFEPYLHWTDGFERFETRGREGDAPPGSHVDLFHTSRPTANWAIQFLREIENDRFFLYAHFTDPHKQYLDHPGFSKFGRGNRDMYDGEVAWVDHHLGRLLRAVDEGPAKNRTVVIVTGDHGEAFGEHGARFHGRHVWDEIVRVPLAIHVPGIPPRHVSRPVGHVDIAPTILDLAGLPPDDGARGTSLLPEIAGGSLPDRPILVDQPRNPYYDAKRAFILVTEEGTFKLHHLVDANTYLLFDLDHDPGETEDLVERKPEIFRRVRRAYAAYVATIPDAQVIEVGGRSDTE